MFTVQDVKPPLDFSQLAAVVQRTRTPAWTIGPEEVPQALLDLLDADPALLEDLARGWEQLGQKLPVPALSAAERQQAGQEELPAQQGWVRMTALGLEAVPSFQQAAGVEAAYLGDLVDRDPLLRALSHWAGRAKDGAMDLRALLGAYAWFQIGLVLDCLRRRLPLLDEPAQQALLSDFAPMLTLIAEARAAQAEGREASDEAVRAAAEAAAEEERMARRAETRHAVQAGKAVPRESLLDLAEEAEPVRAPAARKRRPGGARGPRRRTRR